MKEYRLKTKGLNIKVIVTFILRNSQKKHVI